MLRLSPPNFQRFSQARSFHIVYGGGEANVAVALANFPLSTLLAALVIIIEARIIIKPVLGI